MHARAGSAGHLSAAATASSDLDITVLTHDSGRYPAHQTGATAGRRPDRRAAGSAAPRGCARSIASTGAAGSTTSAHAATATACAGSTWTRRGLIRQRGALLLLVPSPREATVPHRELPGLRLG